VRSFCRMGNGGAECCGCGWEDREMRACEQVSDARARATMTVYTLRC
jgi:hypothetical protein